VWFLQCTVSAIYQLAEMYLLYIEVLVTIVSPFAKIATWRYWFCLSRDVYDGNRSFASYSKTKTVKSDV
jgi:hypothetical protein